MSDGTSETTRTEFLTRNGKTIDFKITEDREGNLNRGWRADQINAFVENHFAGYIVLSWIPKERFLQFYPDIFNFLTQIRGQAWLPPECHGHPWREISEPDKRKLILHHHLSPWSAQGQRLAETLPADKLNETIETIEAEMIRRRGNEFREFEAYFVGKAIDDYVCVLSTGEKPGSFAPPETRDIPSTHDWRRQRIATALYCRAAFHLQDRGIPFYLSTVRSNEGGEQIGDFLIRSGAAIKDERGHRLVFEKLIDILKSIDPN